MLASMNTFILLVLIVYIYKKINTPSILVLIVYKRNNMSNEVFEYSRVCNRIFSDNYYAAYAAILYYDRSYWNSGGFRCYYYRNNEVPGISSANFMLFLKYLGNNTTRNIADYYNNLPDTIVFFWILPVE